MNQRHKSHSSNTPNEINSYSYSKVKEEKKESKVKLEEVDDFSTAENIIPHTSIYEDLDKNKLDNKLPIENTYLGNKRKKTLKPENIRNCAFYTPMILLKKLFKKQFNLNFDSFNCNEVFGVSIGHMRQVLDLQIYQILSYYPDNYLKIFEFSNKKVENSKKYMFFYFMTRTYEELFTLYITGNVNFPCIPNGTLRICNFTLKRTIEDKRKKLKEDNEDEEYIEKWIDKFEKISKSMIEDLKNGKDERKEKSERKFITFVRPEFDEMRNNFERNQ